MPHSDPHKFDTYQHNYRKISLIASQWSEIKWKKKKSKPVSSRSSSLVIMQIFFFLLFFQINLFVLLVVLYQFLKKLTVKGQTRERRTFFVINFPPGPIYYHFHLTPTPPPFLFFSYQTTYEILLLYNTFAFHKSAPLIVPRHEKFNNVNKNK